MTVPRFSLREQRLAFMTGLVLLKGAVVSWGILPRWHRWGELREQASLWRQKLERLEALVGQQPQVEAAYQQQALLMSGDDPESAQRQLLDELDRLAQSSELHLDLKPRPVQTADGMSRVSVEIDAQGTQEALLAFLDQILTPAALIDLDRLRISASTSAETPLRANLIVTQVLVPPAS